MRVSSLVATIVGDDPPVRLDAWDGSSLGPDDAPAVITLRSPDALRRMVQAPGELGIARAYVAGDLDVDGDIFAALALEERIAHLALRPRQLMAAVRLGGAQTVR